MPTDDLLNRSSADQDGPPQGTSSLEGSLADHLAFCALTLLRDGQKDEARFALEEARRFQTQALQHAAMDTRIEFRSAPGEADLDARSQIERSFAEPSRSTGSIPGASGRQIETAADSPNAHKPIRPQDYCNAGMPVTSLLAEGFATILIADEDSLARLVTSEILGDAKLRMIEARNVQEVLALLDTHADARVAILDCNLPGAKDGVTLACSVRERAPTTGILLTCGTMRWAPDGLPPGTRFLRKPYWAEALLQAVSGLLRQHGAVGGAATAADKP